ncbi:galactokinase [bacterium]|nr:galactokinase [bacterium]
MNRSFESLFGQLPEIKAEAHGRINLIGEHTDYNGGFVLPIPIPQKTSVEIAKRKDSYVQLASKSFEHSGITKYKLGEEKKSEQWWDYIQGITNYLNEHYEIGGFDARIETTIPLGSGLASSAALEVSLLRALRSAFHLQLDDLQLARIGQASENKFVGARVGIMDQISAVLGKPGFALFLDTNNLVHEFIALPEKCTIAVVDSGIRHDHSTGDYNLRRGECEEACRIAGIAQLRDLTGYRLNHLPDPFRKRARHVFTENQRVLKAVSALRNSDLATLGSLLYASHESMKTDYEVSLPEIDRLVDLSREYSVYGARLTGGGFGGSVLLLIMSGQQNILETIAARYQKETGNTPAIYIVTQH